MKNVLVAIAFFALPGITTANSLSDFSDCGFHIQKTPHNIKLVRLPSGCNFTLTIENAEAKSILGNFVWQHEVPDFSAEIGFFRVKKDRILSYVGRRSYFDPTRDLRQTLFKKELLLSQKNKGVKLQLAKSMIHLTYPGDLLGNDVAKRQFQEIAEDRNCFDGIALKRNVAITIHWCDSTDSKINAKDILTTLLRNIEVD